MSTERFSMVKKALCMVAFAMLVSSPAFAVPVVDGFLATDEYSDSFDAGWYNGHKEEFSQFRKADDHTIKVYYENTGGYFYLGFGVPIEAKSMIWGAGVTEDEAWLYYQFWSTHHTKTTDTFEYFKENKTDFKAMTDSEKEIIIGDDERKLKTDLAGDVKDNSYGVIEEHADSVDYVKSLGCDETDCDEIEIPMAFEFKFSGLTATDITTLISDIQTNEIEFHLSPERGTGASPVPEPTTMLLLGTGLIGLVGFRKKFKKS